MTNLLLVLQVALAGMLMWSCFCRLVKTDKDTYREIRWAFLFEGAAAGMVMGAPVLPLLMPDDVQWTAGTTPRWIWLTLLLAVVMVQIVTARHWQGSTAPAQFQRPPRTYGGALFAGLLIAVGVLTAAPGQAIAQAKPTVQVMLMAPGQTTTCQHPGGCIAMSMSNFQTIVDACGGKLRGPSL